MDARLIDASDGNYVGETVFPLEIVASGNPRAKTWTTAEFASKGIRVGVWSGQVGKVNVPAYPYDEVFVVSQGRVELIGSDGGMLTVGPGQACLLRKGWQGVWHTAEPTTKHYVISQA